MVALAPAPLDLTLEDAPFHASNIRFSMTALDRVYAHNQQYPLGLYCGHA